MGWPTYTIEIEGFDWEVKVHHLSTTEVEELQEMFGNIDNTQFSKLVVKLLPLIVEWNFTDRDGEILPLTDEGIVAAPLVATKQIFTGVLESLNKEPIPKEKTTTE